MTSARTADRPEVGKKPPLFKDPREIACEIGMGMLAETSMATVKHSDDVVVICDAICEQLGVDDTERSDVVTAAALHDVGKASIPTAILEKPGPLDDAEWQLMRQHTVIGEQILARIADLETVARIVRHSHERWDGEGYPDRLSGEKIPLGSRIIFCADAFHAIRSDRPYRPGRPAGAAFTEVRRCSGTQFDPEVVGAFESVAAELKLAPKGARARRSSRLVALLLVLSAGAAAAAAEQAGLFGSGDATAAGPAGPPIALCGPGPCNSLLGTTVADLAAKHGNPGFIVVPGVATKPHRPAAEAVSHGGTGFSENAPGGTASGTSSLGQPPADRPSGGDQGSGDTHPGGDGGDGGSGGSGGGGGKPSGGGGSTGPASNNPHGSPPGQNGGPPASNNPHGSPPGQDGGAPASNNPHGGPPGQNGGGSSSG